MWVDIRECVNINTYAYYILHSVISYTYDIHIYILMYIIRVFLYMYGVQEKGSKTHVILNHRYLVYENIGNIKGSMLRYLPKSYGSYQQWVMGHINI